MLRLAPHGLLPAQPQPGEVLADSGLELRPAAPRVDILDPQQEAVARGSREQRAVGMAEMQAPGRAGGEAGDGFHISAFLYGYGAGDISAGVV